MAQVRDLLKAKTINSIISVTEGASVLEAMKVMAANNVGAVLVMEDNKITGILSERDIVRKVDVLGKSTAAIRVKEIMTEKVLYVEPGQSLEDCMALMIEKRIRHLPVLDKEQLLGVISVGDVLHEVIHEQKFMISQLEHYIRGH